MRRCFSLLGALALACVRPPPPVAAGPEPPLAAPAPETPPKPRCERPPMVCELLRQCFEDSTWADAFRQDSRRAPMVRVAQITDSTDQSLDLERFAGDLEAGLTDTGKVTVAPRITDLSGREVSPPVGAAPAVAVDFIVSARLAVVVEDTADGMSRRFSASLRIVAVETGEMACVAMAKASTL